MINSAIKRIDMGPKSGTRIPAGSKMNESTELLTNPTVDKDLQFIELLRKTHINM